MDNYHYIIASLPDMDPGYRFTETTPDAIMDEIMAQLSDRDKAVVAFLLRGFDPQQLDAAFYREALTHRNAFIRGYFAFDLNLRNAKVAYLNEALGRPEAQDILYINADPDAPEIETGEFEESAKAHEVLHGADLLARERGLDELIWAKVDSLTTFDYFDLEAVLGFIAKLQIVTRWFRLDEESGRRLFRQLVDEVRGTFKGVQYNDKQ